MKEISRLMPIVIKPSCERLGFHQHQIIVDWWKIVGRNLSGVTMPLRLSFFGKKRTDGSILVGISNPSYVLDLQMQQSILIQKINNYFGYQAISKIKFVHVINTTQQE